MRIYDEADVPGILGERLPEWELHEGMLRRRYTTHNWKGTILAIGAVGHLCEAAWHHPEIRASFNWLEVRLRTHEPDGITDRDLELAAKIDAVLLWRPELEGGALEGVPDDPRFAYLKHD